MKPNTGRYVWSIDHAELDVITNPRIFKPGDKFQSDVFEIANLKWRLDCYPNGEAAKKAGSFRVLLKSLNMPEQWKEMKVQMRLELPQTNTSMTALAKYDRKISSLGWTDGFLALSELRSMNLQQIQIKVSIKIIQVVPKKDSGDSFHHSSGTLHFSIKCGSLRWTIDEDMYKQFASAQSGKWFESKVDVVQKDPLLMMVGHRSGRGRLCFGLRVINAPFLGISSMAIGWRLTSTENNKTIYTKKGEHTVQFERDDYAVTKTAFTSCTLNELKPSSGGALILKLEYETKAIYNNKNEPIPEAKWSAMPNDQKKDYKRCFLEETSTQNEDTEKKQPDLAPPHNPYERNKKKRRIQDRDRLHDQEQKRQDVQSDPYQSVLAKNRMTGKQTEKNEDSKPKDEKQKIPGHRRTYTNPSHQQKKAENPQHSNDENYCKSKLKKWNCPRCTFSNDHATAKCKMCHFAENQPHSNDKKNCKSKPKKWNCPRCTFSNDHTTAICEMCHFTEDDS